MRTKIVFLVLLKNNNNLLGDQTRYLYIYIYKDLRANLPYKILSSHLKNAIFAADWKVETQLHFERTAMNGKYYICASCKICFCCTESQK